MKINERKKDIARKLRFLGTNEKNISEIINKNYSSSAIKSGKDIEIENKVNYHYRGIMDTRIEMMNFHYKFKDIFYS